MTTAPAPPSKRHFFVHGRAAPRAALRVSRWQKEEPTRNARWPASEVHRGGLEPKPGPLRRCVPLSTNESRRNRCGILPAPIPQASEASCRASLSGDGTVLGRTTAASPSGARVAEPRRASCARPAPYGAQTSRRSRVHGRPLVSARPAVGRYGLGIPLREYAIRLGSGLEMLIR